MDIYENSMISIVVPVYNIENEILRCVNSLLNQTYKNIEILLVDDGSTDSSGRICDDYALKDNRVRVFHKKNGGVSSARNVGIENARGYYIAFVDGDDFVNRNMYDQLIEGFCDKEVDVCVGGYVIQGAHDVNNPLRISDRRTLNKSEARVEIIKSDFINHALCDKVYKIRLFKGMRFDETISYAEDFQVVYKVFENINKVAFIPVYAYHYVMRDESATHIFSLKRLQEKKVIYNLLTNEEDGEVKNELWSYYTFVTYLMAYFMILENNCIYDDEIVAIQKEIRCSFKSYFIDNKCKKLLKIKLFLLLMPLRILKVVIPLIKVIINFYRLRRYNIY